MHSNLAKTSASQTLKRDLANLNYHCKECCVNLSNYMKCGTEEIDSSQEASEIHVNKLKTLHF